MELSLQLSDLLESQMPHMQWFVMPKTDQSIHIRYDTFICSDLIVRYCILMMSNRRHIVAVYVALFAAVHVGSVHRFR